MTTGTSRSPGPREWGPGTDTRAYLVPGVPGGKDRADRWAWWEGGTDGIVTGVRTDFIF